MLLAPENANSDLPPIGFCNEPLLGPKYAGCYLSARGVNPPLFEETEVMVSLVWVVRVELSGGLSEFQLD
jgi:hypothetical protein